MKNAENKAKELLKSYISRAEALDDMPAVIDFLLSIFDAEDLLEASPRMPEYLREYLDAYEGNLTEETENQVRGALGA